MEIMDLWNRNIDFVINFYNIETKIVDLNNNLIHVSNLLNHNNFFLY